MANDEAPQFPGSEPKFFYGYIIVAVAVLIMLAMYGVSFAFGVFFNPVLTEFGWTRATTSGAFSLSVIITGLLTIVAGRLNDRFGPRIVLTVCGVLLGLGYLLMSQISFVWQLYLFYGVIIGLGMTGSWVPLVSTTARWFVKRRGMMTGLVVAGLSIGSLISPPIANKLISIYEWRISYFILGSIVLIIIVTAAQFLRRDPEQKGLVPYGYSQSEEYTLESMGNSLSLKEAVYHRQFWLLTAVLFSFGFLLYTIVVHIAPHAIALGISTVTAANVLATIGGISILGNIAFGGITDRIGNKRAYTICFFLISVVLFWLVPATEVWKLYLFAVIFGFARGGINAIESPLIANLFGLKSHGVIYGVINLSFTVGAAVGPFLAGFIFDVTGSYQIAFLVCAAIGIIAFVLTIALRPIRRPEPET
ncbi:MFS transporter [Chloroflexota bacterium]